MSFAEKFGLLCRTLHRRLTQRVGAESDRPYQQLRALRAIDRERVETQSALAERLCIDAPAASRLVDRLVKDGLLKRRAGDDRRCVHLAVTRKAAPEIEAMSAGVEWIDEEIGSILTASELKTFQRVLDKLNSALADEQ